MFIFKPPNVLQVDSLETWNYARLKEASSYGRTRR